MKASVSATEFDSCQSNSSSNNGVNHNQRNKSKSSYTVEGPSVGPCLLEADSVPRESIKNNQHSKRRLEKQPNRHEHIAGFEGKQPKKHPVNIITPSKTPNSPSCRQAHPSETADCCSDPVPTWSYISVFLLTPEKADRVSTE